MSDNVFQCRGEDSPSSSNGVENRLRAGSSFFFYIHPAAALVPFPISISKRGSLGFYYLLYLFFCIFIFVYLWNAFESLPQQIQRCTATDIENKQSLRYRFRCKHKNKTKWNYHWPLIMIMIRSPSAMGQTIVNRIIITARHLPSVCMFFFFFFWRWSTLLYSSIFLSPIRSDIIIWSIWAMTAWVDYDAGDAGDLCGGGNFLEIIWLDLEDDSRKWMIIG